MGKQPFPWYGAKLKHLNFIIPRLPPRKRYVEPFGGSAAVLLNREPASLEVLNDKNGDVMNFFRVLREQRDELIRVLKRTPYHEQEHHVAWHSDPEDLDPVERARQFFVSCTMSYNSNPSKNSGGFAYSTSESRRGRSQHVSRYQTKIENLDAVADRLHRVQFFQRDANDIIERFDGSDALIYLDPPYPPETRKKTTEYDHELDRDQHRELLELVLEAEADVAISTYHCDLYDGLLLPDWNRIDSAETKTGASNDENERIESLYVNYSVPDDGFEQRNTQEQASVAEFTDT